MKYYSTSNRKLEVGLREAVIQGLAPDGGLFMPEQIPVLPDSFFASLPQLSFQEIGYEVANLFLKGDVPDADIHRMVNHTLQFDAPLVYVRDQIHSLELFHGPTLAFKDFGARFLSGLLGYFAQQQDREITILVATSGDTGSAVANGFYNVPGTRVVVLYPSGKVSEIQEKQFTTLGGNITALEIDGTFDDCQRLVKQAFGDTELKQKLFLTSANSINIARLLPQSFYYFRAFAQLRIQNKRLVFSVPSGNFGNLTAGLFAKRMGLPIDQMIAATNANDIVPNYLESGIFSPRVSQATISNAMDVGNPSNFVRMQQLYQNDFERLNADVKGCRFTDGQTRAAMQQGYRNHRYLMDPHGAIGYMGLQKLLSDESIGVFLETAHPAKFKDVVEESIGDTIELPARLQEFMNREKKSIQMDAGFESLKGFLMEF